MKILLKVIEQARREWVNGEIKGIKEIQISPEYFASIIKDEKFQRKFSNNGYRYTYDVLTPDGLGVVGVTLKITSLCSKVCVILEE